MNGVRGPATGFFGKWVAAGDRWGQETRVFNGIKDQPPGFLANGLLLVTES
jgi:hypothetical protein